MRPYHKMAVLIICLSAALYCQTTWTGGSFGEGTFIDPWGLVYADSQSADRMTGYNGIQ